MKLLHALLFSVCCMQVGVSLNFKDVGRGENVAMLIPPYLMLRAMEERTGCRELRCSKRDGKI